MRACFGRLLPIAVSCAVVAPVAAQVEERQRPFDAAGRVHVLTPSLAARLGVDSLLPTGPAGYRVLRLYQRADSSYVLEFVYGVGEAERRTRYETSPELVGRLRDAISRRPLAVQVERPFQDGRAPLIRGSVVLGLGFYGWAVPTLLHADAAGAGTLYLLTASASFFAPYMATQRSDVSRATASLYWYGATRGIGVGLLTAHLVTPDASNHTNLGFAFGGSVLGSTVGALYGTTTGLSRAEAGAATTLGDLGALAGVNAAFTTGLYGRGSGSRRGGDAVVLGSLVAGLVLGPPLARREAYDEGDHHVVTNGALLGMGTATTLLLAASVDDDHVTGASLLGGELAGAVAGNLLARRVSLSEGQGTITTFAMLSGGLLGAGVVLLVGGQHAAPAVYAGASTAGGAGAMLLVLNSYRAGPPTASRRGEPALALGPGFLTLRF
ncbi:MAG: hypothetical protein AUH42_05265 [Gemmatimonadetes bacterium 13_1_40CM_70_11]|nr:MAG: hypothetical protein AUH42_05265 [Gemmatimonadetes bacterium 13_1_40CM_70_11]